MTNNIKYNDDHSFHKLQQKIKHFCVTIFLVILFTTYIMAASTYKHVISTNVIMVHKQAKRESNSRTYF